MTEAPTSPEPASEPRTAPDAASEAAPTPQPVPPAAPSAADQPAPTLTHAPRRLTRVRDGKLVAGVCTGLGKHLNLDPVIVRLLVLLLVFFGGAGIALYLAAWVLVPYE